MSQSQVSQNDAVLSQAKADIEKDGDLARAVRAMIDSVSCDDRWTPLDGLVIKIDKA